MRLREKDLAKNEDWEEAIVYLTTGDMMSFIF